MSPADRLGLALPQGWELTRFGRETSVNGGQVNPEADQWRDIWMIAPNHVESHTGRILGRESASEQAAESGKYLVRRGQIIYSKIRPSLNKVTIAPEDCLCSADMYAISSRGRHDHRYLMYFMLSAPFLSYAIQTSDRVKMPKLNREELAAAPLVRPPLEKQRQIADFLDRETAKIDALIEKQAALTAGLAARREVVRREVILGADHHQQDTTAWFGTPPGHWVIDKLGRHTKVVNGSTPNRDNLAYWTESGFPWLNSSVVNRDHVREADQFVTVEALRECHLPIVHPGAVLVGITGQGRTRGMASLLEMTATINQHVAAVLPNDRHWDPRYLTHLLRAAYSELRFISEESGSTKGALTCADLVAFRLPRPPLMEQVGLAARLDAAVADIDSLVGRAERFIEVTRERRSALITAAVTGQIDVGRAA